MLGLQCTGSSTMKQLGFDFNLALEVFVRVVYGAQAKNSTEDMHSPC